MKRFLSVLVASMFLASAAAYAAETKDEKKAEPVKADAKGGEKTKGEKTKGEKTKGEAKGGEKAKGEAKGDVKASEKAKDAKAGAMGEEKKASK